MESGVGGQVWQQHFYLAIGDDKGKGSTGASALLASPQLMRKKHLAELCSPSLQMRPGKGGPLCSMAHSEGWEAGACGGGRDECLPCALLVTLGRWYNKQWAMTVLHTGAEVILMNGNPPHCPRSKHEC